MDCWNYFYSDKICQQHVKSIAAKILVKSEVNLTQHSAYHTACWGTKFYWSSWKYFSDLGYIQNDNKDGQLFLFDVMKKWHNDHCLIQYVPQIMYIDCTLWFCCGYALNSFTDILQWYLHIEAETKWPRFHRRHFHLHFQEWKYSNFD